MFHLPIYPEGEGADKDDRGPQPDDHFSQGNVEFQKEDAGYEEHQYVTWREYIDEYPA